MANKKIAQDIVSGYEGFTKEDFTGTYNYLIYVSQTGNREFVAILCKRAGEGKIIGEKLCMTPPCSQRRTAISEIQNWMVSSGISEQYACVVTTDKDMSNLPFWWQGHKDAGVIEDGVVAEAPKTKTVVAAALNPIQHREQWLKNYDTILAMIRSNPGTRDENMKKMDSMMNGLGCTGPFEKLPNGSTWFDIAGLGQDRMIPEGFQAKGMPGAIELEATRYAQVCYDSVLEQGFGIDEAMTYYQKGFNTICSKFGFTHRYAGIGVVE